MDFKQQNHDVEEQSLLPREQNGEDISLRHSKKAKPNRIALALLVLSNVLWCSWYFYSRILTDEALFIPGCEDNLYYLQRPDGQKFPSHRKEKIEPNALDWLSDDLTVSSPLWDSLFPVGDGFVLIPDEWAKNQNLPPSFKSGNYSETATASVYLMSGLHQIHCLAAVRALLFNFHRDPKFRIEDDAHWYHARHCIDAIRQTLMCYADPTLLAKQRLGENPGEGQLRVCANWEAYYRWASDNAFVFLE